MYESIKDKTILIVEDEAISLEALAMLLSKRVKKVYTAIDGQEGIDIYEAHSEDLDLIITDLDMPRVNGQQMIRLIREKDTEHSTPIVVISAFHDEMEKLAGEIECLIPKPVQTRELLDRLSGIFHS